MRNFWRALGGRCSASPNPHKMSVFFSTNPHQRALGEKNRPRNPGYYVLTLMPGPRAHKKKMMEKSCQRAPLRTVEYETAHFP